MKTSKFLILLTSILFSLAGCKKDCVTPQEETVIQTENNKNLNVRSAVYTVTPAEWITLAPYSWGVTFSDSTITDKDKAVVLAYISTTNDSWWAIPTTSILYGNDQFDLTHGSGNVTIRYINFSPPADTLYAKIVVIPPAMKEASPNGNSMNYQDIETGFN